MITDDPEILQLWDHLEDIRKVNILRVYCIYDNAWATFRISAEMLKYPELDQFIYNMLDRQFTNISKQLSKP